MSLARLTAIIAVTGLVAGAVYPFCLPTRADELLNRAVAQFRAKEYRDSFALAQTSGLSPQRSFLLGINAQRLERFDEAVPLLQEAEQKLPLLADYAALFQIEALVRMKKYPEALAKAGLFTKAYPTSLLIRRVERLAVDSMIAALDFKGALKASQDFIEKYPSGSDSIELLFQSARCREELDDKGGAVQIYRSIWLNNPTASQAKKARERMKELDKAGIKAAPFSAEELLRRASTLFTQNEFSLSLQTLQAIPQKGQPAAVSGRIDLRTGMAYFRLRNYKLAEKFLAQALECGVPVVSSEARFWLARSIERQDQPERAFALYMSLAAEGKKQEFADDALVEAGGLRRGLGRYAEAAALFEQVAKEYPESRFAPRAAWDAAWCHYLAGDYAVAAQGLKGLLQDDAVREKALYWLARALENTGSPEAAGYYRLLLDEYPAGFYATWYREQNGLADAREQLGVQPVAIDGQLPAGFEKTRLLASLGLVEEARSELSAARKKLADKKGTFPGLARLYLELEDYGSAIALFLQNRPVRWEKQSLPLWTAGYPLVFKGQVVHHAGNNKLSEALIFALIRAESCFSPSVKSPAGAIGLMQLMPATAKATAQEKGAFDSTRLTLPDYNIKLGSKHFSELMKSYGGDVVYSVAAYNAGSAAVDRWRKNLKGLKKDEFIESIPYQETRDYVKKVYASAATYRQLYGLR